MSNSTSIVSQTPNADSTTDSPTAVSGLQRSWLLRAIISGIVGFLCFLAVPFLPVNQTQSSVSWPQHNSLNNIQTPLMSYAPVDFTAEIPLTAIKKLNEEQTLVLGTLAQDFANASMRGLFVRTNTDKGLDVSSRGEVLFTIDGDELQKLPKDSVLKISLTEDLSTVEIPGAKDSEGEDLSKTYDEKEDDMRPDVMGVYTEITDNETNFKALTNAGLRVHYTIDSRFTTSPTILKWGAIVLGLISLVISLSYLARFDKLDGTKPRGILPSNWWKFSRLDWLVTAILLFWHVFGANTSDDGFILTMARESNAAGYMANYYRWYGAPESPFGFPYYDLQALMVNVSTASLWMRLPALFSAFGIWLILSRAILPRLGPVVAGSRSARWTAAFIFLALWLPFNNGTRPEPVVALGSILTWACFERAIANKRLLPAAIALIMATLTLGAGPTGLMAVAAFLVSLPTLFVIVKERIALFTQSGVTPAISPKLATYAMLVPFLPAGTAILCGAFRDQTFAAVMESIRVRSTIGPNYRWFQEFARYYALTELNTVDGSFPRRLGVLIFFASAVLLLFAVLRYRNIQGANRGTYIRMLNIILLSITFLMFTPTKWTHHFGAFAGMAGAVGAMATVILAMATARSVFKKTMAAAAVIFIFAYSLSGENGWWYVSSWKVPWWDRAIQYDDKLLSDFVMYISLIVLIAGIVRAIVHKIRGTASPEDAAASSGGDISNSDNTTEPDETSQGENKDEPAQSGKRAALKKKLVAAASAPILVITMTTVVVDIASMTKAFASQYPAYTVGLGNLRTFKGDVCQLSNDVMVETNTNESFLEPLGTTLGKSLNVNNPVGFGPNALPSNIAIDGINDTEPPTASNLGSLFQDINTEDGSSGTSDEDVSGSQAGKTADGDGDGSKDDEVSDKDHLNSTREEKGVNGSQVELPFDLDYEKVPVMGSWSDGSQIPGRLTSAWFKLPQRSDDKPLMIVTAAGKILHHDMDGTEIEGQKLVVEYATRTADGSITDMGELEMMDVGRAPQWRNLRLEMDDIPESANVVRLKLEDANLDYGDWLAVTPPRVPTLKPMSTKFDSDEPALLDWAVALQFPCQRPFSHYAGVAEIPTYRITPDILGKSTLSDFQSEAGGGVMGVVDAVNSMKQLPAYLNDDWQRDWGTIEIYKQRENSLEVPPDLGDIDYEEVTRWGLWSTGHMRINDGS